jgi:N-acetylmuramoyl-L-alanine amidase
MKIVIDPGHGGSDPGTVGNGLQEKDVTLAVSNILSQLLRNAGYDVVSTRTTDETVSLLRRSQIAAL